MTIYFKNGGIRFCGNAIAMDAACCGNQACCGECDCVGYPNYAIFDPPGEDMRNLSFRLTIANVGEPRPGSSWTASQCAGINGSFILEYWRCVELDNCEGYWFWRYWDSSTGLLILMYVWGDGSARMYAEQGYSSDGVVYDVTPDTEFWEPCGYFSTVGLTAQQIIDYFKTGHVMIRDTTYNQRSCSLNNQPSIDCVQGQNSYRAGTLELVT